MWYSRRGTSESEIQLLGTDASPTSKIHATRRGRFVKLEHDTLCQRRASTRSKCRFLDRHFDRGFLFRLVPRGSFPSRPSSTGRSAKASLSARKICPAYSSTETERRKNSGSSQSLPSAAANRTK